MIDVPLSSVMTDVPARVPPDISLEAAASRLRHPEIPALVVCDSMDVPIGIITPSDIIAAVAEGERDVSVESFMVTPAITANNSTPLGIGADRMRDAGVTVLVTVDAQDTYEGLVSREDLAPYLSRHRLEIDWKDEPLTFDNMDLEDDPISAESRVEDAVEWL